MSIDSDLNRIANALEKISLLAPGFMPGVTFTSSAANTPSANVTGPVDPEIKTVAELKGLAQTIAAGLQEGQIGKFTDYVRNEICARCGVKKLIEIPADRIAEAAQLLLAYKPEK